jgi:polyphosphate kinase 2 (PPK2 family)
VVRVHPEFLEKQKLPREVVTKDVWNDRFQDIRSLERYLTRNGILIRKFFLGHCPFQGVVYSKKGNRISPTPTP